MFGAAPKGEPDLHFVSIYVKIVLKQARFRTRLKYVPRSQTKGIGQSDGWGIELRQHLFHMVERLLFTFDGRLIDNLLIIPGAPLILPGLINFILQQDGYGNPVGQGILPVDHQVWSIHVRLIVHGPAYCGRREINQGPGDPDLHAVIK